jgi:hypothetical protein
MRAIMDKSRTAPGSPPCVRCGYCCNKTICFQGEDDGTGHCRFLELTDDHLMIFSCGKRTEIMESEKDSSTPMFDNYCSGSAFNTVRHDLMNKRDVMEKLIEKRVKEANNGNI